MSDSEADWGHPDVGRMTHAELVSELRRLRVLVNEMSEKLRAAGGDQ